MWRVKHVMLLDSGCTQSVIPKATLDELPSDLRPDILPVTGKGVLANGKRIELYGTVNVQFKLGMHQYSHEFLVAELDNTILLGLDFLEARSCHLDFKTSRLRCSDDWIACCTKEGVPLNAKVQITQNTLVPPRTEYIASARINQMWTQGTACIEDVNHTAGLMIATSLHLPTDQKVNIRLMNTTTEAILVKSGQVVATCSPVEVVETDSMSNAKTSLPPHLEELMPTWTQNLTPDEMLAARELLIAHQDVFSNGKYDVGRTNVTRHAIPVADGTRPIKQRAYRHGPVQETEIEKQVQELQEGGFIREGHGAWSSPVVLVKKKDNSWRFCVDYRRLNEVTAKDAYPLPRIDDSLDALGGSKLFSTLDLTSGYWQVELEEDDKEKAAFVTRSGLWEWEVLPFGLTSAPSTFERLMETVLRGLHWKTVLIYLDDIIVFSQDLDTHLKRLEEVFSRLRKAGLKLKPSKCSLFARRVKYLGHVVSDQGVETDEDKVHSIKSWPQPKHKRDVRAFLGTCGYYRRFIANYSEVSRPLSQLSSAKTPFRWTPSCQESFEFLKTCLTQSPILAYPDYTLPFVLDTDASDVGSGAVLSQIKDGKEQVIAYYSKMFTPEEANYCVTRKELLAIVKAVKHFRPQLYGRSFTARTDHASLTWLLRNPAPTGQLARWIETLSEYTFELLHRKGLKHSNADGLSRRVCSECKQCTKMQQKNVNSMTTSQSSSDELDLSTAQQEDPQIGPIYKLLTGENFKLEENLASSATKKLLLCREILEVKDNGVLYINLPNKKRGRRRLLTVCPMQKRKLLIQGIHEQAHLGFWKTLTQIMLQWYWPGMTGDVRRSVASCKQCQQAKTVRHRQSSKHNHLQAGRPWQVVAVDLCGPLPETSRGNTQILVLADHFTRWYDAIPIADGKAITVARALDERVFSYFGIPEVLHSDRGAQFESKLLEECCKLWGCKKTRTSPYHPQGNSVVERLNKTLGNSLRALLSGVEHRDWDDLLPQIMRAVRASPHRITQETANYLMLGRETRLPDAILVDPPAVEMVSQEEYAVQLQKNMLDVGERLRQEQWSSRTPATEEPSTFQTHDKVWLKSYFVGAGRGAKLRPKYIGPYTITKVLPYQTYEMERNGKRTIQHEGRIRLHVQPTDRIIQNPEEEAAGETALVTPNRPKRTGRAPIHLTDYHLDSTVLEAETKPGNVILGQNSEVEGSSVVNCNMEQLLEEYGGPEKGHCGKDNPLQPDNNWTGTAQLFHRSRETVHRLPSRLLHHNPRRHSLLRRGLIRRARTPFWLPHSTRLRIPAGTLCLPL